MLLQVSVLVSDINDNAPSFTIGPTNLTLSESLQVGTVILNLVATDSDFGPNGLVNYTIVSEESAAGGLITQGRQGSLCGSHCWSHVHCTLFGCNKRFSCSFSGHMYIAHFLGAIRGFLVLSLVTPSQRRSGKLRPIALHAQSFQWWIQKREEGGSLVQIARKACGKISTGHAHLDYQISWVGFVAN